MGQLRPGKAHSRSPFDFAQGRLSAPPGFPVEIGGVGDAHARRRGARAYERWISLIAIERPLVFRHRLASTRLVSSKREFAYQGNKT
jgi:hypothetical protein